MGNGWILCTMQSTLVSMAVAKLSYKESSPDLTHYSKHLIYAFNVIFNDTSTYFSCHLIFYTQIHTNNSNTSEL